MGLENLRNDPDQLKTPERRKAKKPLIEKQRRRRINESLNELKILVLQALNKDPSLYSKMEKADILDLTVNYLKSVKCEQGYLRDATSLAKYRAGYNDCAGEMTRYLMTENALDYHNKAKLLSHVASCCQSANLRSSAELAARSPVAMQPATYVRPVLAPGVSPVTTCPPMSTAVPIFPANYTTLDTKHQLSYAAPPVSTGKPLSPNYCRFLMTSSAMNDQEVNTASLWRPW